ESTPRHRFYMVLSEAEEALLMTLLRDTGRLDDWLRLFSGLIAKSGGKKELIGRESGPGWSRVMEKGACLSAFSLLPGDTWVRKDKGLYRSGYAPEDYEKPKLLLNQTGFRLKAAVDLSGLYVFNNHHVGVARKSGEFATLDVLDFVAGILNSQVAAVIYEFLAMEGGRAMAQVDLDVMRDFPMPDRISMAVVEASRALRENKSKAASFQSLETAVLEAYGFDAPTFESVRKRVLGDKKQP
ncbi:MAG: TaqI-like C-terminal specificity domain-containing protein, partial [Planctomycetota bacterium]|nr:TaqI-like C-terminal specificity domain-containing protein [Planctomycetota bacterium]